jgi:hypothetical protein
MRLLILLCAVAGCATVPAHVSTDPVPLGDWCREAGNAMCTSLADRCFNGMRGVAEGCNEQMSGNCLGGRSAATGSGRSWGELDQCVAQIRGLTCEGLGAGLGSGSLAQTCAAHAEN